jgi:hypothetical protein
MFKRQPSYKEAALQEVADRTFGKYFSNGNFVKMYSSLWMKLVSCEIGKDNDYMRDKLLKEM